MRRERATFTLVLFFQTIHEILETRISEKGYSSTFRLSSKCVQCTVYTVHINGKLGKIRRGEYGWRTFFWRKTQTVHFQRIQAIWRYTHKTRKLWTFRILQTLNRFYLWNFQKQKKKRERAKGLGEHRWSFFCLALHLYNFTFYYSISPTVKTNTHLQFANNLCWWTLKLWMRWTFYGNEDF